MKIYSKFHDYYDIGLSQGVDENIHFNRQTNEIESNGTQIDRLLKIEHFERMSFNRINPQYVNYSDLVDGYSRITDLDITRIIILFCGKQYNLIQLHIAGYQKSYLKLCDDVDQLKQRLIELKQTGLVDDINKRDNYRHSSGRYLYNWFKTPQLSQQTIDDVHRHFKSAIVVLKSPTNCGDKYPWKIITDDNLGDLGFMQLVDSFTAFQQISMYLSNQLASESKPPIVLKDIDKVKKHGFDKQSFRTRK